MLADWFGGNRVPAHPAVHLVQCADGVERGQHVGQTDGEGGETDYRLEVYQGPVGGAHRHDIAEGEAGEIAAAEIERRLHRRYPVLDRKPFGRDAGQIHHREAGGLQHQPPQECQRQHRRRADGQITGARPPRQQATARPQAGPAGGVHATGEEGEAVVIADGQEQVGDAEQQHHAAGNPDDDSADSAHGR